MDEFSPKELECNLDTHTLGRQAVVLDTVDSTNAETRRRVQAGPAGGLVVIADEQTGGRGRRGRAWVSRRGCGLWMTLAAQPDVPIQELQRMALLAGLAVCRATEHVADGAVKPRLKWPNDVTVQGRKLCGILCETATDVDGKQTVIVGIGVNTRTPAEGWGEAEAVAISLEQVTGKVISRMCLAAAIINQAEGLLDVWQAKGFSAIAAGYREYMLPVGSAVAVVDGDQRMPGWIDELDDGGGLLVKLESGETIRIISGEISLRGTDGYV